MDVISKAALIAKVAHDAIGQKRKYSGLPYWTHPEKVAAELGQWTTDVELIAAGWVHDVVEDTPITPSFIGEQLGPIVQMLVYEVTEQKHCGTSTQDALHEIARMARISSSGQLLKLCDIYCNIDDMNDSMDKKFLYAWLPTKLATVQIIRRVQLNADQRELCDKILDFTRRQLKRHHPEVSSTKLFMEGTARLNKAWAMHTVKEVDHV